MSNYNKSDLKSVLLYMRGEFGYRIFRNASAMYGTIRDLAPELASEGNILRQLSELGMLLELEKAAGTDNKTEQNRVLMKIRDQLTRKMFISEGKAEYFLDALKSLYNLNLPQPLTPTQPIKPQPIPPQPTPVKRKLKFPCALWMILALVVLSVIAVFAWRSSNTVTWTLSDDGVLTISGHGNMENYFYDNQPWQAEKITSVVIKYGVKSIGRCAFQYCVKLTSVIIPNSVTAIEDYSFYGCYDLQSINIPDSVITIGAYAFSYCTCLESVYIPYSVSRFGDYIFGHCYHLKDATISNGITEIGNYMFYACKGLTGMTIPDSVTIIGKGAFLECNNLVNISVPAYVKVREPAFTSWEIVKPRES